MDQQLPSSSSADPDNETTGLTHECGVFGCIATGEWPSQIDVAQVVCLGLIALQHRLLHTTKMLITRIPRMTWKAICTWLIIDFVYIRENLPLGDIVYFEHNWIPFSGVKKVRESWRPRETERASFMCTREWAWSTMSSTMTLWRSWKVSSGHKCASGALQMHFRRQSWHRPHALLDECRLRRGQLSAFCGAHSARTSGCCSQWRARQLLGSQTMGNYCSAFW